MMLIGHLAADPDVRKSESDVSVTTFPVATNRDWKTSDGTKKEAVDYHKVVAFRGLADVCSNHLVKGTPVFLEGRLQNNNYEGKDGKKYFYTEIVLDNLNILSYRKKGGSVEVDVKEVKESPKK
jgi:single-strand DNA-binding protein